MKKILFSILFVSQTIVLCQEFSKELFVSDKDSLPYRLLLPKNFDNDKKYPLIIFLHGAGERGNDNEKQLIHGSKVFLKQENREKYKSWVLFPQCPTNDWWGNENRYPKLKGTTIKLVIELMEQMISGNNVDSNRVYVSGLSMGGMGTFEILSQRPDMFAAATPICGSGDLNEVKNYAKKLPIWIFHGSLDKVVLPQESLKIAEKIIEEGGNPKLTLYENVGHDSWNDAFEEKDFLSWIHSKSK